jgi:hypothetical protein
MVGLYLRLRKLTTKYLKMGTVTINEFSTDGTMADNSDVALPTEKAVKTYVDAKALLGTAVKDDTAPELAANLNTAGFEIVDSNDGMIKLNGGLRVYDLVEVKSVTADSGVLSGETGTIELQIPEDSWIIGYSINNEIAIAVDDDDGTYTAAFTGGITAEINGGDEIEAAQNTKVKTMGSIGISEGPVVTIALTPTGTSFTGGKVKATVVYMTIDDLPDAE